MSEITLDGFISETDWYDYQTAFKRQFPDLFCSCDSSQLVTITDHTGRLISKALSGRLEWWHRGFRQALYQLRPNNY